MVAPDGSLTLTRAARGSNAATTQPDDAVPALRRYKLPLMDGLACRFKRIPGCLPAASAV